MPYLHVIIVTKKFGEQLVESITFDIPSVQSLFLHSYQDIFLNLANKEQIIRILEGPTKYGTATV